MESGKVATFSSPSIFCSDACMPTFGAVEVSESTGGSEFCSNGGDVAREVAFGGLLEEVDNVWTLCFDTAADRDDVSTLCAKLLFDALRAVPWLELVLCNAATSEDFPCLGFALDEFCSSVGLLEIDCPITAGHKEEIGLTDCNDRVLCDFAAACKDDTLFVVGMGGLFDCIVVTPFEYEVTILVGSFVLLKESIHRLCDVAADNDELA